MEFRTNSLHWFAGGSSRDLDTTSEAFLVTTLTRIRVALLQVFVIFLSRSQEISKLNLYTMFLYLNSSWPIMWACTDWMFSVSSIPTCRTNKHTHLTVTQRLKHLNRSFWLNTSRVLFYKHCLSLILNTLLLRLQSVFALTGCTRKKALFEIPDNLCHSWLPLVQ